MNNPFYDNWIELRLKGILHRKKLTDVWGKRSTKAFGKHKHKKRRVIVLV